MKFTNTEVWGFEHAIRGARNPMNSWDKSDSGWLRYCTCLNPGEEISICSLSKDIRYGCNYDACDGGSEPEYKIGPSDMDLLQRLIKAGPEHRKFMRQIMVSVDIFTKNLTLIKLVQPLIVQVQCISSLQHLLQKSVLRWMIMKAVY